MKYIYIHKVHMSSSFTISSVFHFSVLITFQSSNMLSETYFYDKHANSTWNLFTLFHIWWIFFIRCKNLLTYTSSSVSGFSMNFVIFTSVNCYFIYITIHFVLHNMHVNFMECVWKSKIHSLWSQFYILIFMWNS